MPVRKNPAYADPYMAKAAENIAGLFAPDSNMGAQGLAWQKANQEKWKTESLSQLYANPNDPNFDRRVTVLGGQTGAQSLEAVAANNATAQRGQDVTAATSTGNNERDNARALQQTGLEQRGKLASIYAAPVIVGEGQTAYTGREFQDATGLPQQLSGQVRAKPGEVVVQPNGTEFRGRDVPLSMDQVRAATFGKLTPEVQQQFLLGGEGVTDVQTPNGPQVQSRAGAIGLPAVPNGDKVTEVSRLITERDRLPAANPNRKAFDDRINALGRGQQQGAYDKETDEIFAKENAKINSQANAARSQLGSLQFMRQLLANPETQQGFGGETALQVRKVLESLGLPVGNTSDAEVARALSNKLALYAKNEGGENLMPGALSDSDRPFLQQQVAGLGNTRGANMKLLDYYERVQRRALDVEGLRQRYVQDHGRIDEGFRRELSVWAESNPVFPEARASASAGTPTTGGSTSAPAAATPRSRILSVE